MTRKSDKPPVDKPRTITQADKVISAFGGPKVLSSQLRVTIATVYRWQYPRTRGGSDGLVPAYMWPDLLDLADEMGVELTADHFYPAHNRERNSGKRARSTEVSQLRLFD